MLGSFLPFELGSLGGCAGSAGDGVELLSGGFREDEEARLETRLPLTGVECRLFLEKGERHEYESGTRVETLVERHVLRRRI
jgi:hypothetical protein